MRIYIADLAAYSAGLLRGEWIDLEAFNDPDQLDRKVRKLRKKWKKATDENARYGIGVIEEVGIHDVEDLPSSFDLNDARFLIESFDSHLDPEAVVAFYEAFGDFPDEVSTIEESHRGKWDSEEDYARDFATECGPLHMLYNIGERTYSEAAAAKRREEVQRAMKEIEPFFAYDRYARDLFISDVVMQDGHVFTRDWT